MATIDRHKSNLVLEIGAAEREISFAYSSKLILSGNLSDRNLDISEEIKSEIIAARLISWLSRGVPDPSEERNVARGKHEEATGSWLLESDKFKSWLSSPNSLLWLNGGGGWCLNHHVSRVTTKLTNM